MQRQRWVVVGLATVLILTASGWADVGAARTEQVLDRAASPRTDGSIGEPRSVARPGVAGSSGLAPASSTVRYMAPVPGQVLRPFEPPPTAYGAGHRGVDLAARPGDRVSAAGGGTVHYAGAVAGQGWVSIAHADGLVTSYGPLQQLQVGHGDEVTPGQTLGRLAPGGHGHDRQDRGLHWGARQGSTYLDPFTLLAGSVGRPSLVGAGGWQGIDHVVEPYEPWQGARYGGLGLHPSPQADRHGYAVAPSANHLVMVPGLASSDRTVLVDPRDLGYATESVTFFSYAGRDDRLHLDTDDPRRDQRPYGPDDTWGDIATAARKLEEQLRAQKARQPGRGVDLLAHSLGGLVVLHYLTNLHDPYDPGLPTIGRVVTIASPHQGTPVATAGALSRHHPFVGPAIDVALGWIPVGGGRSQADLIDVDAPVIGELAAGSSFVADRDRAWDAALLAGPSGPLAMNTEVLTISAATDMVVPASHTRLPDRLDPLLRAAAGRPDADHLFDAVSPSHVVTSTALPGGHTGVLDSEALRETVWRFYAGERIVTTEPPLVSHLTDTVGIAATVSVAFSLVPEVSRLVGDGVFRALTGPPSDVEGSATPASEEVGLEKRDVDAR